MDAPLLQADNHVHVYIFLQVVFHLVSSGFNARKGILEADTWRFSSCSSNVWLLELAQNDQE